MSLGNRANYEDRESVGPVYFECLWGNKEQPDMNTGWYKSPDNALPYDLPEVLLVVG